jgi:hypothetical protein
MNNNPCRNCPDRKAACGVTCGRWAEYTQARDAGYAERRKEAEQREMMCDHFRAVTKRKDRFRVAQQKNRRK